MGKKSRTRRSDQRKKLKRSRKEQQRALYESYKRNGTNKKSKRSTLNSKRSRFVKSVKHVVSDCGNPGCNRCGLDVKKRPAAQPKPYRTSKEYMRYVQNKLAQVRAAAKKNRQALSVV